MTFISHYRILGRLGAGAMGEVYRAVDERLGREVALKLLKARGRAEPERELRLLREAQAASSLQHPGIVTIHDVGLHEGQPYLQGVACVGADTVLAVSLWRGDLWLADGRFDGR